MCVQCYGECSILRTVSAHLMDRGRYHNPLCAVQHSWGGGNITSMSRLLSLHLGMFSFVEGYPHYLGGIIITAKGTHYNRGKIDRKLQHSIDDIIMIFFCNTDDIIHLSLLLGSILPIEVLLDFQDGGILEFGGFEIDITQDYLRSGIGTYWVESLEQIKLFGALKFTK